MPSVGNFRVGLVEISLVIAGTLITSILHELTHGLAILAIGFKVRHTQQDAESRLLKSENLQFDISNGNDDSYCKCYQPVFSSLIENLLAALTYPLGLIAGSPLARVGGSLSAMPASGLLA
ncbi:MAG: hypothetical protein IPN96_04620 [Anaerolineales bacterium]|nr:hypothetical protein [Anaerolineales bacterium]